MSRFDSIEDDILWEFDDNISPKYIGDDMILLLGLTDDKARQLMDDENEGGATMFHTLDKWHPGMRPGHRLTWVHCWGIPLIAWDMQQMKKVVAGIGDLVAVDDDVEELRKLDMARILLKTPWRPLIQHTINVHIQGEIFQVHIMEESGISSKTCKYWCNRDYSSSEEIHSEESDVASPRWSMVATT